MGKPMARCKRLNFSASAMLMALALAACSRDQAPIAEAIKPAQQTMDAAKGMEQTLQKAHENREAQSPKE